MDQEGESSNCLFEVVGLLGCWGHVSYQIVSIKPNTLMPYNSVQHISVNQEPSSGTFITKV